MVGLQQGGVGLLLVGNQEESLLNDFLDPNVYRMTASQA